MDFPYTSRERICLWALAVVGVIGVNGTFLYGLFSSQELLWDALRNPISLAFLIEASLILGALAYLLTRWRVSRLH